jgi:hypothetical protein
MQLETLNGNLKASKARHEADKERVKLLAAQVDLALADIEYCTVKSETSGLVIYPSAKPWEYVPEIEEGATVYMGQTMLLMPDLARMQVKISIHESFIDRMRPGLAARVALPDRTLAGEVSSVASVAEPAGEWNGYVVKYDTIVELRTAVKAERRSLQLGDTNDVFTVVKAGLKEGEEIVLHPFAFKEAQALALRPREEAKVLEPESTEPSGSPGAGSKSKPAGPRGTKPFIDSNKKKSLPKKMNSQSEKK